MQFEEIVQPQSRSIVASRFGLKSILFRLFDSATAASSSSAVIDPAGFT